MSERSVIKATNPDPEDAASYCDDCGAQPFQPCEPDCPCLPFSLGSVDQYEWPRPVEGGGPTP
jgi:hypothetical protein